MTWQKIQSFQRKYGILRNDCRVYLVKIITLIICVKNKLKRLRKYLRKTYLIKLHGAAGQKDIAHHPKEMIKVKIIFMKPKFK